MDPAAIQKTNQNQPALPNSPEILLLMRLAWWPLALVVAYQWIYVVFFIYTLRLENSIFLIAMPAGFFILAGLLFFRRPRDPLAILTSLMLIYLGPYLVVGTASEMELSPGWLIPSHLLQVLAVLLIVLFLYTFPNGVFVPGWGRWVVLAFAILAYAGVFFIDSTSFLIVYLFLLGGLSGLACQVYRYRYISMPFEKQQTKWVVLGLAGVILTVAVWFFVFVPKGYYTAKEIPPGNLAFYTFAILPLTLPLGITVSVLRYRLWDINLIIRRTLIYSALTGLLALIYFGGVVVLQTFLGSLSQVNNSTFITVFSTLLIAALFSPLRRQVQKVIDHRFYRRKYDAEQALAAFAAAAREDVDFERLTVELLGVVQETMQPESISLWLIPVKSPKSNE